MSNINLLLYNVIIIVTIFDKIFNNKILIMKDVVNLFKMTMTDDNWRF